MKGAIAAMVGAAEAIISSGEELDGTLTIAAVVAEEDDQAGTRHFVEGGAQGDFAIVGEPTELDIHTCCKGVIYFGVTTHGRSVHASTPHLGSNAIYQMADVVQRLEEHAKRYASHTHHLLGSSTLNVGTIEGGTSTCIVPAECTVTIDRRVLPEEDAEAVRQEFQVLLENWAEEEGLPLPTLEVLVDARPMETAQDSSIVQVLRGVRSQLLGEDTGIHGFPGVCDANYLSNVAGIPTVIVGPGSLAQAHVANEFIEVDQIVRATTFYIEAARALMRSPGR